MELSQKIAKYSKMFERLEHKDSDPDYIYTFSNKATQELKDSVYEAHGRKLPNNWTFEIYSSILGNLEGYEIKTMDDVEDNRSEIVDSLVSPYTYNLTAWLHDSVDNVNYLTEAIEQGEDASATDGYKLLALAQYIAIDEIFSSIINLLEVK